MLSVKRLLLCDSEERPFKKANVSMSDAPSDMYTAYGPIPLEWFDPSLFPKTAMVTVYVPRATVEQVSMIPSTPQPSLAECFSFVSEVASSSPFGVASSSPVSVPEFTSIIPASPVYSNPVPLPSGDEFDSMDTPPIKRPQERTVVSETRRKVPQVVYGKKTDVNLILSLLDVPLYPPTSSLTFTPRMFLESIPQSMVSKSSNMTLLLNSNQHWHGVGVLTVNKKSKIVESSIFTPDLTSISQYVRPLGFRAGELVLPSNAVCYTSYNKGNRQVTYILTDVLKYADIVRYNKTINPKIRRSKSTTKKTGKHVPPSGERPQSVKNVKRFSYGMTVLPNRITPLEVQFSLLSLMSLSFHLLRKWCRLSDVFHGLLDHRFYEPTFEELSANLMQESANWLRNPLTEPEIALLLKRANCLFKKLVHLFMTLYP